MYSLRHALLALIALAAITMPIAAQRQTQMVPSVLVKAVLLRNVPFNEEARFAVGQLPKRWPGGLDPKPPARLVGSGTLGTMTTVVYRYPRSTNGISRLESLLRRAGYTAATSMPVEPNPYRGFIANDSPAPEHTFCSDSDAMVVRQVDSTRRYRSFALTQVVGYRPVGGCNAPEFRERRPPLIFPVLRPPPGVSASRDPLSYGTRNEESNIRLDSTLSVESILIHYARELESGGWHASHVIGAGAGAGMLQVTARDTKNDEWHGVLYVITGVKDRLVVLRMMRDRE